MRSCEKETPLFLSMAAAPLQTFLIPVVVWTTMFLTFFNPPESLKLYKIAKEARLFHGRMKGCKAQQSQNDTI